MKAAEYTATDGAGDAQDRYLFGCSSASPDAA
jgi:hypothetical protein